MVAYINFVRQDSRRRMYYFAGLLPSLVLVDSVLVWVFQAALLFWWNAGDYGGYLGVDHVRTFLSNALVALAVAVGWRFVDYRRVLPILPHTSWSWFVYHQRASPTRAIWQNARYIAISVVLMLSLYGYGHMIELSGNPVPSELFLLGRYRSILLISGILCTILCFTQQGQALLKLSLHHQRVHSDKKIESFVEHNDTDDEAMDSLLIPVGVMMSLAILLDLLLLQTAIQNLLMMGWFGGLYGFSGLFNAALNIQYRQSHRAGFVDADTTSRQNPLLATESADTLAQRRKVN